MPTWSRGAKAAVIAQLIALAGEIAAAAAGSVMTFGLSDAAGLAATALTRITVREILDELERQLIVVAEQLLAGEALQALSASIGNLISQGVISQGVADPRALPTTLARATACKWPGTRQRGRALLLGLFILLEHARGPRTLYSETTADFFGAARTASTAAAATDMREGIHGLSTDPPL